MKKKRKIDPIFGKQKFVKPKPFFDACEPDPEAGQGAGDWSVWTPNDEVVGGLSRTKAKTLAAQFNGLIRDAKFKPINPGRRARTKGHSFERETAIELRELFPEARRHLEYHTRDANGVDLIGTDPFKIQCKKLKGYAPVNTIREIQFDPMFEIPVLITAADGEPPMAVLSFSDLKVLIREWLRGQGLELKPCKETGS